MSIRIMVVDDQDLIRSGVSMLLSSVEEFEVVAQASDGSEAVAMAKEFDPDVVLMDLRMPTMDGTTATKLICDDPDLHARVLVLTTFDLDEDVVAAVNAGAAGFVLKDAESDELINAVRVVASGGAAMDPAVLRRLLPRLAEPSGAQTASTVPELEILTAREREVLALLGAGCSNAEIAERLFISPATAKTHVSNILAKLGLRDRVQAVVLAHEAGLV